MAKYQLFPMHIAAAAGDTKRVERLIELGMSMDTQDKKGATILQLATTRGNRPLAMKFLNRHKCDGCNQCAKAGYTPLLLSAMYGCKDVVDLLLRCGASVSGIDGFDFGSVLHWTVLRDWLDIVQLVIERGENVIEATDKNEQTPLMWATRKEYKDIVEFLVQAGADVNRKDMNKRTALHLASILGYHEVVHIFVQAGAEVNRLDIVERTALHYASRHGYHEVVQILVQAGTDVNRLDIDKRTALHYASEAGHLEVVWVLLEKEGLDINQQDYIGYTPLHDACNQGKVEVVEKLLAAGADPSIRNKDGETAFNIGIRKQAFSPKEIKLFFQSGVYFEDCDYAHILKNSDLKELVLKDADLCTQSMINEFHSQTLPALYCNPGFAKMIPRISNLKLSPQEMQYVKNFVKLDIRTNTFCNVVKARPTVLKIMCVNSLLSRQLD